MNHFVDLQRGVAMSAHRRQASGGQDKVRTCVDRRHYKGKVQPAAIASTHVRATVIEKLDANQHLAIAVRSRAHVQLAAAVDLNHLKEILHTCHVFSPSLAMIAYTSTGIIKKARRTCEGHMLLTDATEMTRNE